MQSFRTELENPIVEQDILELERKIFAFKNGQMDEEKFRSLRLARGVYGQRQQGVQMIRIKIPYGKLSTQQLRRIADVSDKYSTGNLHITTRQDIQIHYVSLDDTPELWATLEKDAVTLREACGNTVRNVTASHLAGIDPLEPFDVSPYAEAVYKYFLRNPICQDMGRKFKIAFSSNTKDAYLSFAHDLGFIPVVHQNGVAQHGFKVLVGGGMGSQPSSAFVAHEFLPADRLIPFSEAVIRVFEAYGERGNRMKARLKFLVKKVGVDAFMELVEAQKTTLPYQSIPIDYQPSAGLKKTIDRSPAPLAESDLPAYEAWKQANVFAQRQEGYSYIGVKIRTGDLSTANARKLADIVDKYAADDIRLTIGQGLILRYVPNPLLPNVYAALKDIDLAKVGFESVHDIVACPGTDTCNLGIASSIGLAHKLESFILENYLELTDEKRIDIKISGCMNSCGQHMIAAIGFQGMSIKVGALVAPATQILLGGAVLGNGEARYADKVIKIPAKRTPQALALLLQDAETHTLPNETFVDYYVRQGKIYFYELLKELSQTESITEDDLVDWGNAEKYKKAIGVGECAGVTIDLVATLLFEAEESLEWAAIAMQDKKYADAIFHSYNAFVKTAKAILTGTTAKMNSQAAVIRAFDTIFPADDSVQQLGFESFDSLVLQMRKHEPTAFFAEKYSAESKQFLQSIQSKRTQQLADKK